MNPERWKQIEEVFQTALDLPASERRRYIAEACTGDEDLRLQVEALVTQYDEAGDFIEGPAVTGFHLDGGDPDADTLTTESFEDPAIGRRIGAYRITREIGRGGMGAVYLAERADSEFRRRVAVKLIKRGMDTDFILRRFRNERQILASLDHPNIARLLDGGTTEDGLPYFVMEYIEGQPLYRFCDERRLTVRERLRLFRQVCDAVNYAHQHLVIHRDIKPSNILVTGDGVPKLLDFGIAKLLNPELADITLDPTATAMRLMTPEYASPEQVQGQSVTPATDVYSLGVLLYELLTGHRPYSFISRAPHEIARVICEDKPMLPSVTVSRTHDLLPASHDAKGTAALENLYASRSATAEGLRRELAGDIDNIAMKALRKEPRRRYQSAEQLREDITHHLEGRPVSAPTFFPPTVYPAVPVGADVYTGEKSIAVLPLKFFDARRGEDTGDEYLGVGLTDAVITRLSNLQRFVVRPTSSVLRFSDPTTDPFIAGREIGVDYIVDGNIRRAGDVLRVTVQLLSVSESSTRWAGQFDEKLTDVLQLEDAISEQIAGALIPQLTGDEREQLKKRGTDNAEAFEAYLRGRFHWHSLTEEGFAKAILSYFRAVALDPNYALAYAGIADYYIFLGIQGVLPFAESSAAAKEAAQKAVELDDTLAEAHSALGFAIACHDFDWRTAERHHLRSIELNPRSPTAHNWYGFLLLQEGRFEESLFEARRVLEIDPLSPLSLHSLAWCYYQSRRFDEAQAVHRKLAESEERYPWASFTYSWTLRRLGLFDEAIAHAKEAFEMAGGNPLYLAAIGAAYAEAGKHAEAHEIIEQLREMSATRYVSPFMLAIIYTHLGESNRAFELLEEAVAIRDAWILWLAVDPQFDPLRSDERFQELLRRTNNPALALLATAETKIKTAGEKAIAVLPLRLLGQPIGGDTGDEYLGIGLADALIARLSNVRRLIVRPTSSVLRYQSGETDPLQAGQELGVDFIVAGTIRSAGDRIRVTAQLLSVHEGATRWSSTFDENNTDVLSLEDSISEQVARALVPQLTGDERRQLSKRGTDNPDAYEAYLRGRYHWSTLTEDSFAKAIACYYRAIDLDPEYAAAYAAIAEYHCWLAIFGVMHPAECLAAARDAAQKAVELDDTLAEAHTALGFALLAHETQWDVAKAQHLRAIELNPHYATAYVWYGGQLAMEGRFEEADAEMQRACELDPLNPFNAYNRVWYLYQGRRYQESIRLARKLVRSDPRYGPAYFGLSWALRRVGENEEAIEAARKALEFGGDTPQNHLALAAAYAEAGQTDEARRILTEQHELSARRFVTPYHRALIHLLLGERDSAFSLLEQSVEVNEPWIVWLGTEPQLDTLRGDQRFDELLRRTKNPAYGQDPNRFRRDAELRQAEEARPKQMVSPDASPATPVPKARPTEDEEANKLYVAGRYFATRRTAEGLRQGIERFERAVERDPLFALAYAEMADCWALLNWYVEPPPTGAWKKAMRAALRAVEADDQLAEAHASLGFVKLHYDRDNAGAENEFRRAIELKPDNPVAHRWRAFNLSAMGRHEEAISEIRRAQEINPRSPVIATAFANILFFAHRFEATTEQCQKALELDPGSLSTHIILRWSYESRGMCDEALAVYEQERAFAGDTPNTHLKYAHVLAACGRAEEARPILAGIVARRDEEWVTAYEIAVVYSFLNERDEAFKWLALAEKEHAVGLTYVRVDPRLNNLRADPRFDELLVRLSQPFDTTGDTNAG